MKHRYRNPGMGKLVKYGLIAGVAYMALKNLKPAASVAAPGSPATADRPMVR